MKEYMDVVCNIGRDKGAVITVRKDVGEAGLCNGTFVKPEIETPKAAPVADAPRPAVLPKAAAPKSTESSVGSRSLKKSAKKRK